MYKLKIHYGMTAQGHMDWVRNQIWYKNKEFSMDQLRSMMHGLVEKYRKMLVKKMMKVSEVEEKKKKKLLAVLWIKLKNNSSCEKMKYNFIWNECNP